MNTNNLYGKIPDTAYQITSFSQYLNIKWLESFRNFGLTFANISDYSSLANRYQKGLMATDFNEILDPGQGASVPTVCLQPFQFSIQNYIS